MNATITDNPSGTTARIDGLDVSPAWKAYFTAIRKYGGLDLPVFKALPKENRKAAMKELKPPLASMALAFVFGFFYYLAKGMWKKGLVLLAFVLAGMLVLATLFTLFGVPQLVNGLRFAGGALFMVTAPRDFYSFKVLGDRGWMPVRPF